VHPGRGAGRGGGRQGRVNDRVLWTLPSAVLARVGGPLLQAARSRPVAATAAAARCVSGAWS
jgi:hypothetical protein